MQSQQGNKDKTCKQKPWGEGLNHSIAINGSIAAAVRVASSRGQEPEGPEQYILWVTLSSHSTNNVAHVLNYYAISVIKDG